MRLADPDTAPVGVVTIQPATFEDAVTKSAAKFNGQVLAARTAIEFEQVGVTISDSRGEKTVLLVFKTPQDAGKFAVAAKAMLVPSDTHAENTPRVGYFTARSGFTTFSEPPFASELRVPGTPVAQ